MKKYIWGSLIMLALAIAVTVSAVAHAQSPGPQNRDLTGWAWSSNVGWISFNGSNPGAGGGDYKVILSSSGALTGWAWSPNVGWIKFGGLSGIPAGGGSQLNAMVNGTTAIRNVTGWVRACSGTVNGDCASATRTDGWDGWISLSGPNHPTGTRDGVLGNAGVTYNESGSTAYLRGYSWGSDVVGWLRFSPTTGVNTNVVAGGSSPVFTLSASAGTSQANPVTVGSPVTISWAKSDINSCTVLLGNIPWASVTPISGGSITSGQSGSGSISFSVAGTYSSSVRCDTAETPSNTITRSVTIYTAPAPTLSCIQPIRSLTCTSGAEGAPPQFIYGNGIPASEDVTNLVNSCPTTGTHYCTYICQPGYKPNSAGTRCVSSSFEEI